MAGQGVGVEGAILNVVAGIVLADNFASTLSNSVDDAVGPAAEKAGKTFGEKIGKSFESVGKDLSLKLTAPLVAAGGAAVASFLSVDEGLDKVRINTGATGEELAGLEQAVKDIATTSNLGFGEAADVVSTLFTRLNLTGEPLQAIATQIANIGEITGKALDPIAVADFFSAFQIPVDDQAAQLDKLFVVAQKTGVPFEKLIGTLEQNAAEFKQLGFSADEAAVLLAQTEKAGFSTDVVLAGLRKSLLNAAGGAGELEKIEGKIADAQEKRTDSVGKLAVAQQKLNEVLADPKAKQSTVLAAQEAVTSLQRDITGLDTEIAGFQSSLTSAFNAAGTSGKDAFNSVIGEIQRLVAAGDEAGASALAKETFGKGFVEVLQAAQAGAFDYQALNAELGNTAGTIQQLTAETADFPKSLDIARKSIATALEPAGAQIGLIIQQFTTQLLPIITTLGNTFASLSPELQKTIVVIGGLLAALGPVITTLAKVSQIVTGLGPLFAKVGAALMANPWLLALAAVIAIGIVIYKNWESIAAFFAGLWESLKAGVAATFEFIGAVFGQIRDVVVGAFTGVVEIIASILSGVRAIVQNVIDAVVNLFTSVVERVRGAWDRIVEIVSNVFNRVKDTVSKVLETIAGLIRTYVTNVYIKPFNLFVDAIGKIWGGISALATKVFAGIGAVIQRAVQLYIGYANLVLRAFTLVWSGITRGASIAFNFIIGLFKKISDAVGKILGAFKGIIGIAGKIPGLGDLFRADGGPVSGNQPYIVGERGPEVFVPRTSGTIIPNNKLGSLGGGQSYVINVYNPVSETTSTSIPEALRRAAYLRG
jgi:phage-related minor tail protein